MRRLAVFLMVLLFLGCGEKLIDPPDDLIPPDQMTEILYDISIMDAIESNYPNALERNDILVMEMIFRKYGVDSARFAKSDLYYASRPEQYEKIYQDLHDRLSAERDSITESIQSRQSPAEKQEDEGY